MTKYTKPTMDSGIPVRQLPVKQSNYTDHDWVHPKAKYHCYIEGKSMCEKYNQDTDYFETDIESGEVLKFPVIACQVCFRKWKREFHIGT